MNKAQYEEIFLNFGEELTNNFIQFRFKGVEYDDIYYSGLIVDYEVAIAKYSMKFNYKFSIPFRFKEFTENFKESIINRIKIDINQLIVTEIGLDKLGEN